METPTPTPTPTPTREKKNTDRRNDPVLIRRLAMIKARNKRVSLIVISLCLFVIVAAGIFTAGILLMRQLPEDDQHILPNVYVGGVNIGGMTREDAKMAVELALIPILTGEDMVVHLPNDTLRLTPADTGITLDMVKLVDAAYSYGRDGNRFTQALRRTQAEKRSYHIALLPYIKMDLSYVEDTVEKFCKDYNTDLIEPSVALIGERPTYVQGTEVTHQKLVVTMGSPKSELNANEVYDCILDGYSLMNMELRYDVPVTAEPKRPNAQDIFNEYCTLPKDASVNPETFQETKEVVGYGFHVDTLQRQIDRAGYGQVIEITMDFLLPDITLNALNTNLFKDTLASYVSHCNDGTHTNRDINLRLSCEAINGYIIKVGESFDFDAILGPRTKVKGYRDAPIYSGSTSSAIGGGINQTASALYYCALQAGLTINERHAHRYAVTYTPLGTDATITYGQESLVFTNNTSAPIRIHATASSGTVSITFMGTDDKDYTIRMETVVKETYTPSTTYRYMDINNVFDYVHGQVIQTSQTGYLIEVYICKYDKKTGALLEKELLHEARYESRDRIVIRIESGVYD
jgi:vancomycin resistance protein YoaR